MLAFWTGLWCDQPLSQECRSDLFHLRGTGRNLHPPAFATSSRMDLGFDHPATPSERLGHLSRFLGRGRHISSGDRHIIGT